jgi:hypothetical protein
MLKNRSIPLSTIALISVAVVLVAALAMAAYLKAASPMPPLPVPDGNPISPNVAPAPISANSPAAHSVYISEQTLRRWLDDAYERHQTTRVQALLRILNGRYERRSGSPW